jgi:hypothetical protein
MLDRLKQNLSLQNVLSLIAIGAFVANMVKGPSLFVYNLSQDNAKTSRTQSEIIANVEKLTIAVDGLSKRVELSERNWIVVNELVAKEFPRRSELEPRLKAIEDGVREMNMTVRRMNENSRTPYRTP